jgi:diguanylate cyclase (GGDEF)-like protein/PAS domain S-box-containing protein
LNKQLFQSDWVRGGLLSLVYFITAQSGLSLSLLEHSVTVFWPPSGIALAVLLLYGYRFWPWVFIGSFCANWVSGLPLLAVSGIAGGSTLEALLGAYLLNSYSRFNVELTEARDVFRLLWRGGIFSTLPSAILGTLCLTWAGAIQWEQYAKTMMFWWMGDGLGVVLFAPITIAILRHRHFEWTAAYRRQVLVMYAILLLMSVLIFTDASRTLFGNQFKAFTLIAVVVWAALSFNSRVVGTVLLFISFGALFSAATGQGYFHNAVKDHSHIFDLWLFLMVFGMIGVTLSAVNFQRNRARIHLERSERNLKRAQHVSKVGSWELDIGRNKLEWSEEAYRIFCMENSAELKLETFLGFIHHDDVLTVKTAWNEAMQGAPFDIEHRIVVCGQVKWVHQQAEFDFSEQGKAESGVGTITDISANKLAEEQSRLAAKVFDNTNEAILITDINNNIVTANEAFTNMTGYSLEEIKGRNPKLLSSGEHDEAFFKDMWKSIVELGSWQGEIIDKNKAGNHFYKHMAINVVKNEQGIVTHYISISSDISERKEYDKNVHFLAYYDVLTGLPNRTLLRDRLGQMIAAAHRDNMQFALLFLDLDRFKYINDSMGHSVGDKLLQSVAQRLQVCVREGDTVSRIGGDEFIVLLREIDEQGVALVADKLLKTLATPFNLNGQEISTYASVGIALYPEHATDIDVLMKNADAAMYCAKEDGRNNYKFFTPEMNFRANQVFLMEKDLRVALEQDQFTLVYQPQVDLMTGKICGAEALLRWKHPEKGFISPAEFIPVAEETGQIVPIGEWVVRTACWRFASWQKQGMPAIPIAVNLSIRQLRQPNLAEVIEAALEENGLDPHYLELEITEGIMMGDTKSAMAFLSRMHSLGVQMSIDDFGTGFSSLSYLKNLPVNKLKIDQSFVRDIETDESDAAIVRSIISLGHRLDLKVIAEGVETLEQLDFLRIRGCDEVQGYYFSRPLSADDFQKFVNSEPALLG